MVLPKTCSEACTTADIHSICMQCTSSCEELADDPECEDVLNSVCKDYVPECPTKKKKTNYIGRILLLVLFILLFIYLFFRGRSAQSFLRLDKKLHTFRK
jgi:hypothetical protein